VIRSRGEAAAWCAALLAALLALAALQYRAADPDSVLHAEIAARLGEEPPSLGWIAPEWPPGWYVQGLYREHPAGLFLLPALMVRLGYPAGQSAYAANALYQALAVMLVPAVAAAFASGREARALAWLLQLLPVAFVFRIRANHEGAIWLFFLVALLGTERLVEGRRFGALLGGAGLAALVLVKGLLAAPAILCCALWARLRLASSPPASRRRVVVIVTLAAWAVALAAMVVAYEILYRQATGVSFVREYLARQTTGVSFLRDFFATVPGGGASAAQPSGGTLLSNVAFYAGRIVWFAFPWSLALLVIGVRRASTLRRWAGRLRDLDRSAQGALFVAGAAALYVGLLSLSGRRAERYLFPVYFLVGACGAVAAFRAWPAVERLVAFVERIEPYAPVVAWSALFALHLLGGPLGLPRIQLWRP
jgi:hypothetical protein